MVGNPYHLGTETEGAGNLVHRCLRLQPGERLVIIADQATRCMMELVRDAAADVTGSENVSWRMLEELGERDRDTGKGLPASASEGPLFESLLEDLRGAPCAVYAGVSLPGEQPLRRAVTRAALVNGGRFLHLPNLTRDILCMGFCADQEAMQEYTMAVYRIVENARWAQVTGPAGTDAWFSLGLRWTAAGSILRPGEWANVGAEVWTCPVSVEGRWVSDGGMGDEFTRYGSLERYPLTFSIRAGIVAAAESDNRELGKHFRRFSDGDPRGNGWRIGEFAIGTNPEIAELGLIGVNMQDEKALPHIATGDSRPYLTMAGILPERFHWTSDVHVDETVQGATIVFHGPDGTVCVLRDGKPTKEVFSRMVAHADRLKERLEAIRLHREKNDRLPPEERDRLIRLS